MRQKKGFAVAVREGCLELPSEVGRVSERTRFKRSSRSIRAQLSIWKIQVRTKMKGRLPEKSVAATSLRCRCNFWIRRNVDRRRAVVSSARKPSQSLKHSPSCRVDIRWDAFLALVLVLCKGCSHLFTLLSLMRRIFASGFRTGFVLSFRWIPSVLNYSDEESRFFDRDYDSSKSLLALAQRFAQSSPSRSVSPSEVRANRLLAHGMGVKRVHASPKVDVSAERQHVSGVRDVVHVVTSGSR